MRVVYQKPKAVAAFCPEHGVLAGFSSSSTVKFADTVHKYAHSYRIEHRLCLDWRWQTGLKPLWDKGFDEYDRLSPIASRSSGAVKIFGNRGYDCIQIILRKKSNTEKN